MWFWMYFGCIHCCQSVLVRSPLKDSRLLHSVGLNKGYINIHIIKGLDRAVWPLQVISAGVRELLGITQTPWSRSIADPPRDTAGLFLEQKSRTGERADELTYQRFLDDWRRSKWITTVKRRRKKPRHVGVISYHNVSAPGDWWGTRCTSHARLDIHTSHQQNTCKLCVVTGKTQLFYQQYSAERMAACNMLQFK